MVYGATNFKRKVEGGLMSGWKTTSIFGSIINYCIMITVMSNLGYSPTYCAVLGDDIDLSFDERVSAVKI